MIYLCKVRKERNERMFQLTQEYLDDLMVRMAHHSTAIEGNSLTLGETKSLLIDNYIPRAMDLREFHEVINYKAFMPFFTDAIENEVEFNHNFIREVHAILCKNTIESVPGEFKTIPNMIIGADFIPTPPYQVVPALEDWRLNLKAQLQAAGSYNDEIIAAICRQHIEFERIHPFPDGNGRVGRALMVYSCLSKKIVPIIIPAENRTEYLSYLAQMDENGLCNFAIRLQKTEKERLQGFQAGTPSKISINDDHYLCR